jgi:hypothetical protein
MSRLGRCILALSCALSGGAQGRAGTTADLAEMAPRTDMIEGPRGLHLASRFGFATVPLEHETLRRARGHGFTLLLGGRLSLAGVTLGMTLPLVVVSVAQPAGAFVDGSALGNLELFAERSHAFAPRDDRLAALTTRLSLTLPVAAVGAGDLLLANRALAVASALDGWSRQELYAPRTLGVGLSVVAAAAAGRWALSVEARLPVVVRLGSAERVVGWSARTLALAPAAAATGRLWVTTRLGFSLSAQAVANLDGPTAPGVLWQLALRPALLWRIGAQGALAVDLLAPIGGPLGGKTLALGLDGGLAW